jgi:methylmalonyl-CoA mutase N-terminal domain/subunit
MGGTVAALERNFFQQEIADSAYTYQVAKERGEKTVVGVNQFREDEPEEPSIPLHSIDPRTEQTQKERLARVKRERDSGRVRKLLDELKEVARTDENLMPVTIECVRAYATKGEIANALKEAFGLYREPIVF